MSAFEKFKIKSNLADTTLRQYKGILNKILEPFQSRADRAKLPEVKKVFDNYTRVIENVEKISNISTKKNYYSFIVKFMKTLFPRNNIYVKYNEKLKEHQKEIDNRYDNGKLTEKQRKNWKNWDEILKIKDDREERINKLTDEYNKGNINKIEYAEELLDFIILGLYTYQNPRRNEDYTGMKYMKTLLKDDELKPDINYYFPGNKEVPAHFVFQNFKTKKNYSEPVRIKINEKLNKYIKDFLNLFKTPPEYALNQITEDKGLRADQIIKSLKRTSGLTSSDFRRSFLTYMLGPTIELEKKKKELAYNMGHSKSQMKYVKDVNNL